MTGIGNWEFDLATQKMTASANARQLYGLTGWMGTSLCPSRRVAGSGLRQGFRRHPRLWRTSLHARHRPRLSRNDAFVVQLNGVG
jgi:hypothetical protein